jgi:uncharacterized alkaline shock family protein YloU
MEQNGTGFIKVSEEVINKIAYTAALETEGVCKIAVKKTVDPKKLIKSGMKLPKGVSYVSTEDGLVVDVSVVMAYGAKIQEVAANIQANIMDNVQTMTGLNVCRVNVTVIGVENL